MNTQEHRRSESVSYGSILQALMISAAIMFVGVQLRQLNKTIATNALAALFHGDQAQGGKENFDQSKLKMSFDQDFIYGSRDAHNTLIVYLDFECPFCASFYPQARQFVDASGGKTNLVIRLFPLEIHAHADYLANAAQCIGEQKGAAGFYAFSDKLFAAGRIEGEAKSFIAPILESIGVNDAQFETCISSRKFESQIKASVADASAVGVSGTPTSVLLDNLTKKAEFIKGKKTLVNLNDLMSKLQ